MKFSGGYNIYVIVLQKSIAIYATRDPELMAFFVSPLKLAQVKRLSEKILKNLIKSHL